VLSVVLAALTTYLLLDRNHAEEIGGGARIAADVLRGEQVLPLTLVLALVAVAACVLTQSRAAVGTGARRR
jgi:hypothetical protein